MRCAGYGVWAVERPLRDYCRHGGYRTTLASWTIEQAELDERIFLSVNVYDIVMGEEFSAEQWMLAAGLSEKGRKKLLDAEISDEISIEFVDKDTLLGSGHYLSGGAAI